MGKSIRIALEDGATHNYLIWKDYHEAPEKLWQKLFVLKILNNVLAIFGFGRRTAPLITSIRDENQTIRRGKRCSA